jgi:hypothetical protein
MDTYTCAMCGETYKKGWSDEEAKEEYEEAFPCADSEEPIRVVCDDCYKLIMPGYKGE